jgi:hypothetical protein
VVLAGDNGHRLELELLGYQFPAIEDDERDSNWLNIRISATNDQGSWNATDPSIGTVEVAELADWLEAIAEREEPACELEFIEPNLAFELAETNGSVRLRAWFELRAETPVGPGRRSPGSRSMRRTRALEGRSPESRGFTA